MQVIVGKQHETASQDDENLKMQLKKKGQCQRL